MSTVVAAIAAVAISSVLVAAGVGKLVRRDAFLETLRSLGCGPLLAKRIAVVLPTTELIVGLSLVLAADRQIPSVVVALLGCMFGLAGLVAVLRRREIACSCFGVTGGVLGRNQVALTPVWLAGAWLAQEGGTWTRTERGLLLMLALVLTSLFRFAVPLGRARALARDDRSAIGEFL